MHLADRKWELIKRDPIGREFDSLFKQWLKQRKDDGLKKRLWELEAKISKKYCCGIYIPESTTRGLTGFWFISADPRISVKDAREGGTMIIGKGSQIRIYDWEKDGIIYCPSHNIPIFIDPTTLTLNDERRIKQEVWDIVKKAVKKSTDNEGRWEPIAPEGEPQELARVLRLGDDTFKKYLHWYDLKMGGLTFRLIAFVTRATSQERREKLFQDLTESKKKHRVRETVQGESAVRQGFNLIYEAIHRLKCPSKETAIETQEIYNCPIHGTDCNDWSCPYLKDWQRRFNASPRI